jgi:hypothetical protein
VRTLTYYVGVTLDGYIAAPDGSFDFFPVTPAVLDFIAEQFLTSCPPTCASSWGSPRPATGSTRW